MISLEKLAAHELPGRRRFLASAVGLLFANPLQFKAVVEGQEIHKAAIFAGHVENPIPPNDGQGSLSASGIPEYKFNDELAALFNPFQKQSMQYELRYANQNIPIRQRPSLAQKLGAEVYIELHHDSAQASDIKRLQQAEQKPENWSEMSGYSVIYNPSNSYSHKSLRLAQLVAEELFLEGLRPNLYHAKDIGGERRPLVDSSRAIYTGREHVIRESKMPAIIVEAGVIANPFEESSLRKPETQRKIAEAIDRALAIYFQIKK